MPKVSVKQRYEDLSSTRKALLADCETLLSRFQSSGSVRFELFTRIWREMKFHQIFYGVKDRQVRTFSRMILDVARTFFMSPFSFQIRVGGLYLLYSLYHSQTASPKEPVRLALRDWADVKKFEKDAMEALHYDVVYILRQLKAHKAFLFTAMPDLLIFKSRRAMDRTALCEKFIQRASRPQELITNELLEEVSNIQDIYMELKDSLFSGQTEKSVNLIRINLVPQLSNSVMEFYKWQQRMDGTEEVEDSGEGTSSQQDGSKRAELLASIKSKAFEQPTEAAKSRRHRQVEVDTSVPEAKPLRSRCKPSLKTRTIKKFQISDDACKELTTTTCIHHLTALDYRDKPKPCKKSEI